MPRLTAFSFRIAALLAPAILVPPTAGYAAEIATGPSLHYDLSFVGPERPVADAPAAAAPDLAALECMAKVVHHESRGQPHRGMLAVAQTLVNRLHAGGRFGGSICEVANQPGQFFRTASYNPRRDGDWTTAMDVAREALAGAEDAAPGAMYFHAAGGTHSSFFRRRQKVAAIGGQVFYR